MALFVCRECLGKGSQLGGEGINGLQSSEVSGPAPDQPLLLRVGSLVGAVLGGIVGMLSGQPVVVVLAAALVGSEIGSPSSRKALLRAQTSSEDVCEICGVVARLERCVICGEWVCPSCRGLIMAEEERSGKHTYRHYEKADTDDEAGSHALAPWYVSDEPDSPSPGGYHLSEEAFVIDEDTGELIPVPEEDPDDSLPNHDLSPTDEWDFDSASVSPATADWESSDGWSSMTQDVDSWETDSADSEGGS